MTHPIKKPTSVDATKCPTTRFREPVCHSCFTLAHVIISRIFLAGWLIGRSGLSVYEKADLGSMWCTAGCALDEDMVCDVSVQAREGYLAVSGLVCEL
jgi:hypothetical protein